MRKTAIDVSQEVLRLSFEKNSEHEAHWSAFWQCWLDNSWVVARIATGFADCDPDDIAGDVLAGFLVWFEKRLELPQHPKAFLRQAARNAIIDSHRKRQRETPCAHDDLAWIPEPDIDPVEYRNEVWTIFKSKPTCPLCEYYGHKRCQAAPFREAARVALHVVLDKDPKDMASEMNRALDIWTDWDQVSDGVPVPRQDLDQKKLNAYQQRRKRQRIHASYQVARSLEPGGGQLARWAARVAANDLRCAARVLGEQARENLYVAADGLEGG